MIINKILGGVSLLGIVCSLSLAILYQTTKSDLKLLKQEHRTVQGLLEDCAQSKAKFEQSVKVTDQVVFTDTIQQKTLNDKEDGHIQELNNIPRECPKVVSDKGSNKYVQKDNVAGIDDDLPSELTSLLDKVHNKGSGNTSP